MHYLDLPPNLILCYIWILAFYGKATDQCPIYSTNDAHIESKLIN